jgi:PAS domain S-box-containing protein
VDETELDRLIAAVYRCPGDTAQWVRFSGDLADSFGAEHAHLVVMGPGGVVEADTASDPAAGNAYSQDYATRDLAVPKVMVSPAGLALWSHSLLSVEELARCPVQNELLPRVDVGSRSWVHTLLGPGRFYSTGLLHGRQFAGPDGNFSTALQRLHSHINQAMALHMTIEEARTARQAIEAGFDALPTGLLLLDHAGRVIYANRAAERLFGPARLRLQGRQLALSTSAEDAALRRLIVAALGSGGGGAAADSITVGHCRVCAVPVRMVSTAPLGGAAVALMVEDRTRPGLGLAPLRALGLTPAEAGLVAALVAGDSLAQYAARTGRSLGTLRAQLKSVFAKTGTHRQAELVAHAIRIMTQCAE